MHWYLVLALATLQVAEASEPGSLPRAPIGMNLEVHTCWSTQKIFVDAFKRASWVSFELGEGGVWDTGVEIPSDEQGYPLSLPFTPPGGAPNAVATFLYIDQEGHYPQGTYTLHFEGEGVVLVIAGGSEEIFFTGGSYPIEVDPSTGDLMILLLESNAQNHVRNIRFILPGHNGTYEQQPFFPPLLDRLSEFSAVRYSQTMRTNDGEYPCDNGVPVTDASCEKLWETRPTVDWYTQATTRGVALETLIDLANAASIDPWFCVPHAADDNYVREMARMIDGRLDSGRKFYIELSNEIWNPSLPYPQSIWATNVGVSLGLDPDPEMARNRYVAMRSYQIFHLFEQELGSAASTRLVKVMPGFLADPMMNAELLEFQYDPLLNPNQVTPDVLAVGAYFGGIIADEAFANGESGTITPEEIVRRARENLIIDREDPFFPGEIDYSLATMLDWNRDVAQAYGVPLVAYEGGQHIVQNAGWGNDPVLGLACEEANRHRDMGAAYREMLDIWDARDGELFMHYSLVRGPSYAWGFFGSLEYTAQNPLDSPKFQALRDWVLGL